LLCVTAETPFFSVLALMKFISSNLFPLPNVFLLRIVDKEFFSLNRFSFHRTIGDFQIQIWYIRRLLMKQAVYIGIGATGFMSIT
jgi:hypothetical protein